MNPQPEPHSHLPASDWLVWQLADSAFPAGGFAHSGGLEALVQHGFLDPAAELTTRFEAILEQAVRLPAPFVAAVHQTPNRFEELDQLYDAQLSNHVANRASRAQGRSFLTAIERILPPEAITQLSLACRSSDVAAHLPTVLGAGCRAHGLTTVQAVRLFVFMALRGCLSAAVRLGVIGPLQAQGLQFAMSSWMAELTAAAIRTPPELAAQVGPLLDLLQQTHDRLYSRLFQS